MKLWTKFFSVMIATAVILSMGLIVFAVETNATDATAQTYINDMEAVQAVNRYFEERNAYLLGESDAMDWPVAGLVNDEASHILLCAEKNIVILDIYYTIGFVENYDTYTEVGVTEVVSYIKEGVTAEEEVIHTLYLHLDHTNTLVVAADAYLEMFSTFVSCSYVNQTIQSRSANTAVGGSSLCIVEIAKAELGVTESEDNITKYGAWYGLDGEPWCAMFVSWCADQANVSTSVIKKTASCRTMCGQFESQNRFFQSTANGGNYTPVIGDILFVGTTSGYPTHVGIVALVEDGKVWMYDGNWQDKVSYHCYSVTASNILGYGHPAYENTEHVFAEYEHNDTCHWQICNVCGYTTEETSHSASVTYDYDGTHHWKTCTACGIEMNRAMHLIVDLGNGSYKCRFCDCRIFWSEPSKMVESGEILGG